jgi:N-acetylglucosamine-6-sulfatase
MKRRDFLKQCTFITAGPAFAGYMRGMSELLGAFAPKIGTPKPQPNIVFLFSDDHAFQAISVYGSKINKTPNIDRLAKEGAVFERCFCCNSICAPSRAAILTGKHSHANGLMTNGNTFDGDQQTFPKLLQKAGYQTALIGKWHLRSEPQGFDYWEILPGQGSYYNPDFKTAEGTKRYVGYATDITTDLSLKWLKQQDNSKPFLLMCQHKAPHRTWAPGPEHLTMYDDVNIPEPENLFDDYSNRSELLKANEMSIAGHLMYDYDLKIADFEEKDDLGRAYKNPERRRMTEEQRKKWDQAYGPKNEKFLKDKPVGKELVRWKYQRYIKDYLRCVASIDDNIGRILDYLNKEGLADNTIVVYSSDQGFYLGEHGWYDKRWMYEESFRMPLLVKWPGVTKAGCRVEALAQNIDFGPTFLDAAGIEVPDEMQGVSLQSVMKGKTPKDWRKSLYYHYYEEGEHNVPRHDGVRTSRYKLIHFYDNNEWELFDLEKDPHEMQSVFKDPAYSAIVTEMQAEYTKLRKQYGVEAPKSTEL